MSPAAAPLAIERNLQLIEELNAENRRMLVELASAIAWENYRARFNRVFGVQPAGFLAEGAFCVLPERQRPQEGRASARP